MIQFENVSKYYKPDIIALEDITFTVESGEFMFLVGPSGAGKSTLVRLIIRQELPTQGAIVFEEVDIKTIRKSSLPYYRQQIGVVFQDYKLIDVKTIRENIEFALEITGKHDSEIAETTDSLLDVVGLTKRQELFPNQLSGGEKQRAAIARAMANDPKMLIADEPTGNLDPDTSEEIMSILKTVNDWGTTVMIATHDKDVVDAMKKRVVRLEDGKVVSDKVGGYGKRNGTSKTTKHPMPETSEATSTAKQTPEPTTPAESISVLGLSDKVRNALEKNDISDIDTLLDTSEESLVKIKGIGKKKAREIISALESYLTAQASNEEKS